MTVTKLGRSVLLLALLLLCGCRRGPAPVVVKVVMLPHGKAFHFVNQRVPEFLKDNPHVSWLQPIQVEEIYPRADQFVQFVTANPNMDIIVCDSPEQLDALRFMQRVPPEVMNACTDAGNCPAFIARSVQEDRIKTVKRVFYAVTGSHNR